ncbi:MAG: leucyl/phenylalanyl-tRNA--protein transferase [Rhodospirillaceae bacterium]|nr:leucyl/phenylalanyl-tRNA--protein transferase [Rhodospirillaceae bacterium]
MSRPTPGPHKLTPEILVRAYAAGIFPMSEARDDPGIFWVDPKLRGILPLDDFHISKSLRKVLKKRPFQVTVDTDFRAIIEACADTPRGEGDTWINDQIIDAYTELHDMGLAHSVECRMDGKLVGGLYGVALKGAFCGESMFSARTNASKVALVHLVARLRAGGYVLLDTQFITDHLERFGAIEIPARHYLLRLEEALQVDGDFYCGGDSSGSSSNGWGLVDSMLAQSSTQTS